MIRQLVGLGKEQPIKASLVSAHRNTSGLRFFSKGQATYNAQGQLVAKILPGQESFKISPLVKANCWIDLNKTTAEYEQREIVNIFPLIPGGGLFD